MDTDGQGVLSKDALHQNGIVNPVQGVARLHVMTDFRGRGCMQGRIAGQFMAEMLVYGRAVTMDAAVLDLARFVRGEAQVELRLMPHALLGRYT